MRIVTLLSDFGLEDPFVGEMKGVLLTRAPGARPVDLTHGLRRGAVREAAWVLLKAWEFFPEGTCHLAVVDPGVGGERRALAARAGGHFFVGPDNGLLFPALQAAGGPEIRRIDAREPGRPRRGSTFDGRDVFAPAAAHLARGGSLAELGPLLDDPRPMASFAPVRAGEGWEVEIVRVDRFGDLVTVAEEAFLRRELGEHWREVIAHVGRSTLAGVRLAYEEVAAGEPLLAIGGAGTLEVAVNGGSAAERFGLGAGDRVRLRPPEHRAPE